MESSKKRKPDDSVNVTDKGKPKPKFDKIMDKQCLFHPKDKHSSRNCHGIHSLFKTPKKLDDKYGDEGVDKDKQAAGFQPADMVANVIFRGIAQDESK